MYVAGSVAVRTKLGPTGHVGRAINRRLEDGPRGSLFWINSAGILWGVMYWIGTEMDNWIRNKSSNQTANHGRLYLLPNVFLLRVFNL